MATDQISYLSPFVISLSSPAEVVGGLTVVTPANLAVPASDIPNDSEVEGDTVGEALDTLDGAVGAAQATATSAQADATQAADDALEALANSSEVWAGTTCVITSGIPGESYVPAPVTGTVAFILAATGANPGGDTVFVTSINGTPITNGGFTFLGGSAPGSIQTATPSGANAVVANTTSVGVAWDAGSGESITVTVLFKFVRA